MADPREICYVAGVRQDLKRTLCLRSRNMVAYSVIVENDHGHLVVKPATPANPSVDKWIKQRIHNKYLCAVATDGTWCRFFFLKEGLTREYTHNLGADTVRVQYDLPLYTEFDPAQLRWV